MFFDVRNLLRFRKIEVSCSKEKATDKALSSFLHIGFLSFRFPSIRPAKIRLFTGHLLSTNAKASAKILSRLPSNTLHICTVRLPDRNIPLEWMHALCHKCPVRNSPRGERFGRVPESFQRVLSLFRHKP
jgi:hypothetical protein